MLALVAAVLSLATRIPLIGIGAMLVSPAPIVLAAVRHGMRLALLCAALSTILLTLLVGPIEGAMFFIVAGASGLVIGMLARTKCGPERLFVVGALLMIFVHTASFFAMESLLGVDDPLAALSTQMREAFAMSRSMLARLPVPQPTPEQLQEQEKVFQVMEGLLRVPVFLFTFTGVILFLVDYHVSSWVLRRLGVELPPLPAFHEWRLPLWAGIIVLAPLFIPVRSEKDLLESAWRLNAFFFTRYTFVIIGLAASAAFFKRRSWSRSLRWPAMFMMALPLQNFTMLYGVLDTVAELRAKLPVVSVDVSDSDGSGPTQQ